MPMSKERQGQIAILFIKGQMLREGVRLRNIKREAGSRATNLGISTKEAQEFAEIMIRELVDESFSGTWADRPSDD